MSPRLPTPLISETITSGMAINFSRRMKISPKGFTQSVTKPEKPQGTASRPIAIPTIIPSRIRAYKGMALNFIRRGVYL